MERRSIEKGGRGDGWSWCTNCVLCSHGVAMCGFASFVSMKAHEQTYQLLLIPGVERSRHTERWQVHAPPLAYLRRAGSLVC